MVVAGAAGAVRQEGLLRGCRKRQRKAVQDPRRGLGERVRDRRKGSPAGGVVFHADRRSADRRRYARAEDRAGNMRRRGARRGQEVHSEWFPFQANPTSRLTARTASLLRRSPSMPTCAGVWRRVSSRPSSWPASCRRSAAASPSARRPSIQAGPKCGRDDPVVKTELLELASVCEEVANNIEDHLTGG